MATGHLIDGQLSWAGGCNSIKPTTIQSAAMPDGLPRNCLSWGNNISVRDGGISPRGGYNYLGTFHAPNGLYQGKILYQPIDDSPAYFLEAISGHILQVYPDSPATALDLSAKFGLVHPATLPYYHFVQGEQFVVIQAGDLVTLPLFWDGAIMRRSTGIVQYTPPPNSLSLISTGYWTVPAASKSLTIKLTAPYPGALNDKGHIIASIFQLSGLSSSGVTTLSPPPAPPFDAGEYTVTAISGNSVTFLCNSTTTVGTRATPGTFNFTIVPVPPPASELPAAGPMDYFLGRIWYAQGSKYSAGDIVGGPAGTLPYNFTDSILKITENPLAIGGDGFSIPSSAGNIRSIKHTANLDAPQGQGQLIIGTRKSIYQLNVPVSRTEWIAADGNNQPRQTILQINNGTVGDRSVVNVNGDVFYMSLEPSIRSLISAIRYFGQWGNRSISSNEQRVLQFVDRNLLRFSSGITFDNRLFMTSLPTQTAQGVVHKVLVPLDFIPMSSFGETAQPVWQGVYEGLDVLQLMTGDFGGVERAFATARLQDGSFSLWELTNVGRSDTNITGEARIQWSFETPAFTYGQEWLLKKMVGAELWIDRLSGEVMFDLQYRPDASTCWLDWHSWKVCSARNSSEDCNNPIAYPLIPYGDGFKQMMSLPVPPDTCIPQTGRPSNVGFQFQARLNVRGYCRIRGLSLFSQPVERSMYSQLVC